MTDNNYNIIKPLEDLQNISGLSPIKNREERKRRQSGQPGRGNVKDQARFRRSILQSTGEKLKSAAEYSSEKESIEDELSKTKDLEDSTSKYADNDNDMHSIDYCA